MLYQVFPISRQRLIEASYGIVNINIFREKASHSFVFSLDNKKRVPRNAHPQMLENYLLVKLAVEMVYIFSDKARVNDNVYNTRKGADICRTLILNKPWKQCYWDLKFIFWGEQIKNILEIQILYSFYISERLYIFGWDVIGFYIQDF